MPKGTATCNNFIALLYNATAWANIADNASSSPIANILMRLTTATGTPSDTGSTSEAAYINYAAQNVARSTAGWTAPSGGATSNAVAVEFPQCGLAVGATIKGAKSTKGAGASDVFHYGDLNSQIDVSNLIQPRFPIGAITITES